jgi:CheY-like chemotaxis protein
MKQEREEAARKRDDLASLGRISGELLHDLANEVTVLQGWALIARGEQEAGRHAAAEIERVLEIATGMGTMLRETLETIAGQRGSPEAGFDPVQLTVEALEQWTRELAGIAVRLEISLPRGARVAGRPSFWSRSLRNLLTNAARHARSEVVISLGEEEPGAAREIVLRVENDGLPIPPAIRRHLFEPLTSGEEGRYGLGLSSTAWAVQQLGGRVACVESRAVCGAAFEIRVPLAAAPSPGTPASLHGALQGRRVVIIEHSARERRSQTLLLRRLGAEVLALTPEHDEYDLLVSRVEGALPHLVLLDLDDPGRDALAIWNRVCVECPELAERVVFTTGGGMLERGRQLAGLTGQPFLEKPLTAPQLLRMVSSFLPG